MVVDDGNIAYTVWMYLQNPLKCWDIVCIHFVCLTSGTYTSLLRELVAEFTLTDNPANTTTSLLRTMCHVDDSVILGSWLQETDHKAVEDQVGVLEKLAWFLLWSVSRRRILPWFQCSVGWSHSICFIGLNHGQQFIRYIHDTLFYRDSFKSFTLQTVALSPFICTLFEVRV